MKLIRTIFQFHPPQWHVWNPFAGFQAGAILMLPSWILYLAGLMHTAIAYTMIVVGWAIFATAVTLALLVVEIRRIGK